MTDDEDLTGWLNTDVCDWGLGDEQLESVADAVRRLVLGERISRGERQAVVDTLAPIVAEVGLAELAAWLAEQGEH